MASVLEFGSTTVAIVGVGAVGGVVAARLHRAGHHSIVLVTRTPFECLAIDAPDGDFSAIPAHLASPNDARPVPWVMLATKAYDTASARDWLGALANEHSTIAILQNGVEHVERVVPFGNGAKLLPVVVECPATRLAPGRIVQRGAIELTTADSADGRGFRDLFVDTPVKVTLTTDFVTSAWRKLCHNVAGGAITAWTRRTMGVIRRPSLQRLARELIEECVAVGRAEGARVDASTVDHVLESLRSAPVEAETSMYADRLNGRPLEIDARNGAVVRIGARHGIATPRNRDLVRRLS